MLERVLEIAEGLRFVQKLGGLKPRQRLPEIVLVEIGHRLEDPQRHVLADHRRGLEQALLPRRQAVDAGGQDGVHGGRDPDGLQLRIQTVGAAFTDERPGLDQGPHTLLEKEGIALGSPDQERFERVRLS